MQKSKIKALHTKLDYDLSDKKLAKLEKHDLDKD